MNRNLDDFTFDPLIEPADAVDDLAPVLVAPTLEVIAMPVLSYALAHNRVPVISKVTVGGGSRLVRGARLAIALHDAHGLIGSPDERILDIEPDRETILTNVDFRLDPAAMFLIEEQRPGKLIFQLFDGEILLSTHEVDVQLLAANQWLARPLVLGLELLASFVMPNHSSIAELNAEAAVLLERKTGSDAMEGYQGSEERVDAVVQAIVEAAQARGIRYVLPPASWSDLHGQKVRNPEEVLDHGAGTCLDTVVVLAAALEQAGIRPLLWIVEGHAFLGYWRVEQSLVSSADIDAGDVINLIDLGAIGLIETTAVTNDGPIDFRSMHQQLVRKWLSGSNLLIQGVTDVYRARRNMILPLPARRLNEAGHIVVTKYVPAVGPVWSPAPAERPVQPFDDSERSKRVPPPPRVTQWKNALLDLSLRNRLINFTDHARMPLTVPPERVARFEDEISDGQSYTLNPSDRIGAVNIAREVGGAHELPVDVLTEMFDSRRIVFTSLSSNVYLSRLRNLAYKARTLIEETGANNLYLAFGSLIWSLDGRELRSPLILVPVSIAPVARQSLYRVTLDESGSSTPNYCLLEKLRQTHGLEIPELEAPDADGSGINLEATLLATRQALAAKGLGFRVEATVDLAVLQFAKYRLWKDLDEQWEAFEANSLVRHLIRTPFEPFIDPVQDDVVVDLDDLAAKSPMPADSSQLAAVAEAVSGKTFVLEGPPGTGKSQTITNLLTRAIADGKNVLFVAEKRAALDVVQRRLDEVGLGAFSLDLHDRHSKPNEVRRQIKAALEAVFEVDEQGYVDTLNRLEASRRRLESYPKRLHERNAAGHSYYSARTQELTIDAAIPRLPIPDRWPGETRSETIVMIRSLLNTLADVTDAARPADPHPWGFIDSSSAANLDASAIRSAAAEFDASLNGLPSDGAIGQLLSSIRQPEAFAAVAAVLNASDLEALSVLDQVNTTGWKDRAAAAIKTQDSFASTWSNQIPEVAPEALHLDLTGIDREANEAAASGFFGRKKRLKAAAARFDDVLAPGRSLDVKHLTELTGRLKSMTDAASAVRNQLNEVAGIDLSDQWNPLLPADRQRIADRIAWLRWNASLVDERGDAGRAGFVTALRSLYQSRPVIDRDLANTVRRTSDALGALAGQADVASGDFFAWSGEAGLIDRWRSTAIARRVNDERATTIAAWCALLDWVEPMRTEGLNDARRAILNGTVSADDAVRAFEAGIAEASRRERAEATGIEPFDDRAHERRIHQFTEASAAIRKHLTVAIPNEVVRSRAFDPKSDAGRVGRLTRELNRQRGGMGVRTLLDNFGDLITSIMPCVLVSPDSVARFFPARGGLFDIVVFDEASQIRVADSIGAMGRGRSVVVVGDSKQMPPTAFAEPTTAIEELFADDSVAEDEESILTECVNSQVPRQWLSWHYRSQDEALIAFSNQQYYEQKLSSFPAPVHGSADPGPGGHGVSLINVGGVFHRNRNEGPHRTNPVEARAIVDEIVRRFEASPERAPSIGVVTFNIQQRNYIESLLQDSGNQRIFDALEDPDGLFVKNLENVQGDERDAIFFSTAFSVNERGVLPLNFGPLNRVGGERRLNVAITRARRQVIVFTSFEPQQLRAEETSSVGVKHLRAYLDIAAEGTRQLPDDGRPSAAIDRHREEIADALRERGYAVRTNVGLSEFRIDLVLAAAERPEHPVMAVLLDGESWAKRKTVGDRDGLPQDVLSRMLGWPSVERVWMPAWLNDREAELDEIERAFDLALQRLEGAAVEPVEPLGELTDDDSNPMANVTGDDELDSFRTELAGLGTPVSSAAPLQPAQHEVPEGIGERYVEWAPRRLGGVEVLDLLPAPRQQANVAAALSEIVEIEGPVHYDRLVRLVATGFGLSRVSASRERAIMNALEPALRGNRDDRYAWPTRIDRNNWRGFRRPDDGTSRPIDQVNPIEIANAMAEIAYGAAGIEIDELKRETLALFGGRRLTTLAETSLAGALETGIASGRLRIDEAGMIFKGDPV